MPVNCNICLEDFSEKNHIPKILECGHTICSVCLGTILKSNGCCPTCKSLLGKRFEEYPTNYIIFDFTTATKDLACSKCPALFLNLLDDFEKTLKEKEDVVLKFIERPTGLKYIITVNLEIIRELRSKAKLNPKSLKEYFTLITKKATEFDEELFRLGMMDVKPTFSLANYVCKDSFQFNILDRLHKGEKLYAFEMFNSTPKFGKITRNEHTINIHTMDMSSVEKSALIVPFSDLKKCIKEDCFRTFMKIGEEMISFSIHDSSYLAFQFIKICSGEAGFTFKGANFSKKTDNLGEHLRIENYMRLGYGVEVIDTKDGSEAKVLTEATKLFNDYDLNKFCTQKVTGKYNGNQLAVQMFCNGVCVLSKWIAVYQVCLGNVVATCPQPFFSFSAIDSDVITDCGISLIVENV